MGASDTDLLRDYAQGSEAAFAALVRRHLNLVYSAARRQVRSPQLAEEVAQSVFCDLARQAARFPRGTALNGWLYLVTRRTAIDTMRRETRRQSREQAAGEISAMNATPDTWTRIEPLLDEAMETLPEADRGVLLLRFFEDKSLREVGATLGTSDDAAQKRVSRAVEQLRAFFLRRGIAVTAAGLATDLSAHALQMAPSALGAVISAAALSGAVGSVATVEATRIIVMTTLQKSLAVAAFVVVGGAGFYESAIAARGADDLGALGEQTERTAADIRTLRLERDRATARLKAVEQQIDTRLAQARASNSNDATLVTAMTGWLSRVDRLKQLFAQRPELNIPEMQYLKEDIWFLVADKPLDSDEEVRRVASNLRQSAENLFSPRLSAGLRAYVTAHDGMLPASTRELAPFLNPPVDQAILDRYEMLRTGRYADLSGRDRQQVMGPRTPPDPEFDSYSFISPDAHGSTAVAGINMTAAWQAFVAANPGQRPKSAAQLKPFLKWPMSDAATQKYLEMMSPYQP